jgi:hypothetical protein
MYYTKYLYMFRAILCLSSGGQNCISTASGIVVYKRPCSTPVESGLQSALNRCTGKISRAIYRPDCDTPLQFDKEHCFTMSQRSRYEPANGIRGEENSTSNQYSVFFTSLMCLTPEKFQLVTAVPFHEMNNVTWQRSEVF